MGSLVLCLPSERTSDWYVRRSWDRAVFAAATDTGEFQWYFSFHAMLLCLATRKAYLYKS